MFTPMDTFWKALLLPAATRRIKPSNRPTPEPDGSPVRTRGGPALIVTVLALCGIVVSL